jgi:hypothetical protein
MATHNSSVEKVTKNRERPFRASSEERVKLRGSPTRRLTLDSPALTLDSPALRVGNGKSGVGGVEGRVSWICCE